MSESAPRVTFTRALRIDGYNWPLYAAAGIGVAAGMVVAGLPGLPLPVRWLGGAGALVAGWSDRRS